MCGLLGWYLPESTAKNVNIKVLAAILGTEMDNRGGDSWGVALPLEKSLFRGLGKFNQKVTLSDIDSRIVMAHTRKATRGEVIKENAHPFVIGNVVGAHNGIIHDHDAMNTKYGRNFQVDSQHLIAHIAEDIPLSEISGMGSVEYYKRDKVDELYLGRGQHGELAIIGVGKHENPQGIVWASTTYALEKALWLAGIKEYFPYQVTTGDLYKVKGGVLYEEGKFDLSYRNLFPGTYQSGQGQDRSYHSQYYGGYGCGTRTSENDSSGNYLWRGKDYLDSRASTGQSSLVPIATTEAKKEEGKEGSVVQDVAPKGLLLKPYVYETGKVLEFPEDLKKNQEVSTRREEEAKADPPRRVYCSGCGSAGFSARSYGEGAEAILYWASCDQSLCWECSKLWVNESSGSTVNFMNSARAFLHGMVKSTKDLLR